MNRGDRIVVVNAVIAESDELVVDAGEEGELVEATAAPDTWRVKIDDREDEEIFLWEGDFELLEDEDDEEDDS